MNCLQSTPSVHLYTTVYTFSTPVQSTPSVHLYTTVYTFITPVHYSLHLQYTCTLQCSTKSRKKCAYTLLNKIPEKNCARSRKKYIRILKIRLKPRILSKIASVSLTNQRPRCCNTSKSTWSFIVYNLW